MSESLQTNQSNVPKTLSEEDIFIRWFFFLIYLLILGSLYNYFSQETSRSFLSHFWAHLPEIIGNSLATGIVPFIIALIRKIKKKKPTKGIFILYFIISAIFFSLLFFSEIKQKSYGENYNSNGFVYHLQGNEFTITFENKPRLTKSSVPFNGKYLTSEIAETYIQESRSMCKTECFNVDKSFMLNINENYIYNYLRDYSVYNGLSYPTFQYEESSLGKVGSVRAYKTLTDDNGDKINVTYFSKQFFGEHSVMIIYVGCPSEDYPSTAITKFIDSVVRL